MNQNGLLLERYSGRPPGRLHEGQIITLCPNLCWTFDAFEIPRSHCASFQIAPLPDRRREIRRCAAVNLRGYYVPFGSERSSAWLEHLLWEQDVAGSNPVAPTTLC